MTLKTMDIIVVREAKVWLRLKHSEETKRKLSIIVKKRFNDGLWYKKPEKIFQLDLECNIVKLWQSASDIKNELKIDASQIAACYNCKRKSSRGFRWILEKDYNDLDKREKAFEFFMKDETKTFYKTQMKAVYQINKEGQIIKEIESIGRASRETGINRKNIGRACKRTHSRNCGGFKCDFSGPKDFRGAR